MFCTAQPKQWLILEFSFLAYVQFLLNYFFTLYIANLYIFTNFHTSFYCSLNILPEFELNYFSAASILFSV